MGLFAAMIYNYHNAGHYPSSCLLFETQCFGNWIPSPSSGGPETEIEVEPNYVGSREDGGRILFPKCCALNKTQDDR
jgi:hypothetical protein